MSRTGPLHADEVRIDVPLVQALVERANPDWRTLPIEPLSASGSTNALFRLGSDLLVRLPRQPGGGETIVKEARWLPRLAAALPVAAPEIVAVGAPGFGYPERWAVVRWLDGETPVPPGRPVPGSVPDRRPRHDLALDLARLLQALHGTAVPAAARLDAGLRWYRGEPLITGDRRTRQAIEACRGIPGLSLDLDAVLSVWEAAFALPEAGGAERVHWYHGDLMAENLLVRDGRLTAVLDFGGLAIGDPTVDLIVAWEVLDSAARRTFREALEIDEATWQRARAWALSLAVNTFPYYWRSMPDRCTSRLALIGAVLADAT